MTAAKQIVLPAREEMFARHFGICGDITHAYQLAFPEEQATATQAYRKGRDMLRNQGVKARAREVRAEALPTIQEMARAIAQHDLDVLNAPRDLVQHLRGACRYCYGVGHRYQWMEHEYMDKLAEAEHHNKTKGRGVAEMAYPDPLGGFGYDEAAPPVATCPACKGRGTGRTFVRDTSELSPEQEAAFEGLEITASGGLKALFGSKADAKNRLMKLLGLGSETVRILHPEEGKGDAPQFPDDPQAAADMYRDFIAGRLTGPSDGG